MKKYILMLAVAACGLVACNSAKEETTATEAEATEQQAEAPATEEAPAAEEATEAPVEGEATEVVEEVVEAAPATEAPAQN